jgi:hypothetical protein
MPRPKMSMITASEAFSKMLNGELIPYGKFVVQNLKDHPEYFTNPTIPLDQVEADLDELQCLVVEATDGARSVIAQRNQQRDKVLRDMRIVARYVGIAANGNPAVLQISGLNQAYATRQAMQMLSSRIRKIQRGNKSGEVWIYIKADDDAIYYEIQYAPVRPDQSPAEWILRFIPNVKSATILTNLTPGMNYAFQARIMSKSTSKFTDWTDPVIFMPS